MKKLLTITVLTVAVLSSASSAVMAQDSGWISTPYDGRKMSQPYAHPGLALQAAQARHQRVPTRVQGSEDWLPGGYSPRVDIE